MKTLNQRLGDIITGGAFGRPNKTNMNSFIESVVCFGVIIDILKPHRFVQLAGQVMLESGEFRYDTEIWDGKGAQARYDTRTDLGNTPEVDGDGFLYRGRGPIQITGKTNYRLFTAWARKLDPKAPDFVANPHLVNTDPWEGLVALWFWQTNSLNRIADTGDTRKVTRRINGGYNHLADRIAYVTRLSLVVLGYEARDVRNFQKSANLSVDGYAGPITRAALHDALKSRPVL
jgi:putative chitinase